MILTRMFVIRRTKKEFLNKLKNEIQIYIMVFIKYYFGEVTKWNPL